MSYSRETQRFGSMESTRHVNGCVSIQQTSPLTGSTSNLTLSESEFDALCRLKSSDCIERFDTLVDDVVSQAETAIDRQDGAPGDAMHEELYEAQSDVAKFSPIEVVEIVDAYGDVSFVDSEAWENFFSAMMDFESPVDIIYITLSAVFEALVERRMRDTYGELWPGSGGVS